MFKEIIPIVLILLLHNNTNSGNKYLVETKGNDEAGHGVDYEETEGNEEAELGVDYEEVNTKVKKEVNTKDKKDKNTTHKKEVNTKDKKEVNSKDKKQDKDGEDYFFPGLFGWKPSYSRPSYSRPRARYARRPARYGRGGCPKF